MNIHREKHDIWNTLYNQRLDITIFFYLFLNLTYSIDNNIFVTLYWIVYIICTLGTNKIVWLLKIYLYI